MKTTFLILMVSALLSMTAIAEQNIVVSEKDVALVAVTVALYAESTCADRNLYGFGDTAARKICIEMSIKSGASRVANVTEIRPPNLSKEEFSRQIVLRAARIL